MKITQKQRHSEAKEWLNSRCHQTIMKGTEDFQIMSSFLLRHPNYDNWINTDIEYFKITRAPKKKSLQVYIKMKDISKPRLVSWTACVKGNKEKEKKDTNIISKDKKCGAINKYLNLAMRAAVMPQVIEYSFRHPNRRCALCESFENIEVDHYPKKFREIRDEFLENTDQEIPGLFFLRTKWIFNQKVGNTFEIDWIQFHYEQATYRYLCASCNQKSH